MKKFRVSTEDTLSRTKFQPFEVEAETLWQASKEINKKLFEGERVIVIEEIK